MPWTPVPPPSEDWTNVGPWVLGLGVWDDYDVWLDTEAWRDAPLWSPAAPSVEIWAPT